MRKEWSRRWRLWAAAMTLMMAALLFVFPAAAAEITFPIKLKVAENYTMAFETLKLVNAQRSKAGLDPVVMDKELLESAMQRATEISLYFEHQRPDHTDCFTAFPDNIWGGGENIAAGQSSASAVMNSWMNSAGHKANILNPNFDAVGIGCVKSGSRYYWTQCFVISGASPSVAKPAAYTNRSVSRTVTAAQDETIVTAKFHLAKTTLAINETTSPYVTWTSALETFRLNGTSVVMRSSNTAVCKIENGKVRAVGSGTAKITVFYKGYMAHKDVITVRVTTDRLLLPTTGLKGVLTKYNQIKLTWSPVSGASGYAVYMAAPGENYKLYKKTTLRAISIGSLKAGAKYRFIVKGYDAKGRFSEGNTALGITTLAAPAKINVVAGTDAKVNVFWREVIGASGYQVSRTVDRTKAYIVADLKAGVLKTTVSAKKGTAYAYKVRAYRTYGTTRVYGPWSYVMTVTTK